MFEFITQQLQNVIKRYDDFLSYRYESNGYKAKEFVSDSDRVFYWDNEKENVPVLILIHGFGGDGKLTWMKQAFQFCKEYRVIIPDLLWFGKSTSNQQPSLRANIHALNNLMEHLSIHQAHIAGISYGGFVVLGMTHYHNAQVKSLTIVNSPGHVMPMEDLDVFCEKNGVDDVSEIFVPRNGDELKRLFDLTFHKEPFVPKLFMPQLYHQFFDGCHDEKTQLLDELPSNKDKIKAHPDTPTLILWGEDDAIFNIQYAPKLQQELSAELITVPGAGHGLPAEMPSQFNTNLLSFLKRIDAQAN